MEASSIVMTGTALPRSAVRLVGQCQAVRFKIFDDGRIRLCLYWEDIHYQLIVKTTSVNAAQSDYIAGHLSTRFDLGWRKR